MPYTNMCSLHLLTAAVCTVAAAAGLTSVLQPAADYFAAQNYPGWLVRWGHPGNMAVVLTAMGGYGAAYLGWSIRTSDDKVSEACWLCIGSLS